MVTGYEAQAYRDLGSIAKSLERIAAALEAANKQHAPFRDATVGE